MSADPKSSGSSTSSGESEGSDSDSKRQAIVVHNLQSRSPDRPSLKKNPRAGGSGHLKRQDGATYALDAGATIAVEFSDASATSSSTSTPSRSTTGTSASITSQQTLDGSEPTPYLILTCYARDFLASPTRWLGSGPAFKTLAANSSLKSLGLLRSDVLAYCSLRTSWGSSQAREDGPSERYSQPWMRWGMMRNGRCLTASALESRRTGSASSLSDILEASPGEKYFLSERALKSLLTHNKDRKVVSRLLGP